MVKEAEKKGVKIDWFDNVIGKLLNMRGYQKFAQMVDSIRKIMEALQKRLHVLVVELKRQKM